MDQKIGAQSLRFTEAPFIVSSASIVGTKEGQGPLADEFDMIGADDKFGQDTWEESESALQKEAVTLALGKADMKPEDIRYIFAGDLLGQNIASSFGLMDFDIPILDFMGHVPHVENLYPLQPCVWQQGMRIMLWQLHQAILRVRRNNFVFPWNMPIKDPYQLPGRSQEVEPLYLPGIRKESIYL